jgi:hypothetical protein
MERQKMVDGGDSQARTIQKGHGIACHVNFSWEIWKKGNAQIFRDTYMTSSYIIIKIKEEVALWSLAGAKAVSDVMPQE